MVREQKRVETNGKAELEALAHEVDAPKEQVVLRRDVVRPAPKQRLRSRQPVTRDDPLFALIGIGASKVPGGVSGRKHEQLLDAHRKLHS